MKIKTYLCKSTCRGILGGEIVESDEDGNVCSPTTGLKFKPEHPYFVPYLPKLAQVETLKPKPKAIKRELSPSMLNQVEHLERTIALIKSGRCVGLAAVIVAYDEEEDVRVGVRRIMASSEASFVLAGGVLAMMQQIGSDLNEED